MALRYTAGMSALPHATPLLRTDALRSVEQEALAQGAPLMERAGQAAATLARELAGDSGKAVLVLAGPGNNGGDALVVARHLRRWWFPVTMVCLSDPDRYTGDAATALLAWRNAGGTCLRELPAESGWSLIIDGLFGIGLKRELASPFDRAISYLNDSDAPVLSLDLPSGLDADSGRTWGCAAHADHTITFIAAKPGLLTGDGPDHCGRIHLADLGLRHAVHEAATGVCIGDGVLDNALPPRLRNSHKGTYGNVGVIGGAPGMTGAVLLAARAALRCGAGRVYAGCLDANAPAIDLLQPELMLRTADVLSGLDSLDVLAIGPGLGRSAAAQSLLRQALERNIPLVLDADALNLMADIESLKIRLPSAGTTRVLTPHPAEAARLLGCDTTAVQNDRVGAALRLARQFNAGVALKGCGTVCAWPDGHWAINSSGNPGMAAAGMGDVLTGMIAALLAQGTHERQALAAGVWLHGAAADTCVTEGTGPVGLTASEIIDSARRLLNRS